MRNKSLFLLLACVCGTVAAIGVSQWMQANVGKGAGEQVEIFVTATEIGAQEELTADKVKLEEWPKDRVPTGATNDFSKLEGRYAKVGFVADEPVLLVKLMNEKEDVIVPKGFSVVSLPATRDNGTANLVRQGDRVDVSAYFNRSEFIPRTTRKDILLGVRVFAIDGQTKRDDEDSRNNRAARSISLLIRKTDKEAWTYANKLGELELTLASPGSHYEDAETVNEPSEAAQGFLTWMDKLREVQEQARLQALQSDEPDVETPNLSPAPKKKTWTITKIVNGQMVVYEFTEGNPVPRIIADTNDPNGEIETEAAAPAIKSSTDELDYLNGSDSPLFQPRSGKDGTGL